MVFALPPWGADILVSAAKLDERKRKRREEKTAEQTRAQCRRGRCEISLGGTPPTEDPPEEAETPSIPRPIREAPLKLATTTLSTSSLLPFDVYYPRKESQFLGNEEARKRARIWLEEASLGALQQTSSRRSLDKAALLLYGPTGSGKSAWARFIVESRGMSVSSFCMGDHGGREHEKLDFWLGTQTSHDLKGRLNVIILEDVEELFKLCPSARKVKPRCPVIFTAGSLLDASLRRSCNQAIFFGPLRTRDAAQLVRRIAPEATDTQVRLAQECAGGDIRQLQLIASSKLWNTPGGVEMSGNRSYDRAREVLYRASQPAKKRPQGPCLEEEDAYSLAPIVHYNFPDHCAQDDLFLENFSSFLSDAATFDAYRCLQLLPLACRNRGLREVRGALKPPPQATYASLAPQGQRQDRPTKEEEATGAHAAAPLWVNRKCRFKSGDGLAASLLSDKLGRAELTRLSQAEHRSGESFSKAYLSRACVLSAQEAVGLLTFAERVQKTFPGTGRVATGGSQWPRG